MQKENPFFIAPNLEDEPISNEKDSIKINSEETTENSTGFSRPLSMQPLPPDQTKKEMKSKVAPIITENNTTEKKQLPQNNSLFIPVNKSYYSNPHKSVIVRFSYPKKKFEREIEIPLHITSNELIIGLNMAYNLGIDISDAKQCYLSCENPIALLKGNRILGDCGVRDGSLITFIR